MFRELSLCIHTCWGTGFVFILPLLVCIRSGGWWMMMSQVFELGWMIVLVVEVLFDCFSDGDGLVA